MRKILTSAFVAMIASLFASIAFPCTACAQNQHAGFFNGGTSLTATCTQTSGALISSDAFLGTLQGNTTLTLPAASIGCVDRDVIDIRATQASSQAFTLTVNAGTGTVTKVLTNSGTVLPMPAAGAVTSVVLHQIWVYDAVAATPQWELVTQETNPATAPTTVITSTQTFTTDVNVPAYRAIVIAGAGGGASSTGAAEGGNGGGPAVTLCELQGGGGAYTVTIGTGGAKGAAGANGSDGIASSISAGGATACSSNPGLHGVAGTASVGAGGTGGTATSLGTIIGIANQFIAGISTSSVAGIAGSNGSFAVAGQTLGIAGGFGCAGANCTTDTAGANGEVIFIPEL